MTNLRVGVIGAGWVATARHIPSYLRLPNVEMTAIYDRHPERSSAAAALFGIESSFDDFEAFLAAGLDAVSVCTPPWLHASQTIRALGAGIDVFCEKPMAMNSNEARSMVEAARASKRLLCISHNFLFSRSVRRADRMLGSGRPSYAWGMQLSSPARRLPEWYEQLPGGLLLDESPHMLYVLTHYLGGPLRLVAARSTTSDRTGLPATAEILLEGTDGTGQVTMCFESPVSEWHVGVVSPERVVGLDLFRDIATSIGSDGAHTARDIAATSAKAVADHVVGFAASGARLVRRRQFWGHDVLIERFIDAVSGRRGVPVDLEVALSIVALTDEILGALDLTGNTPTGEAAPSPGQTGP